MNYRSARGAHPLTRAYCPRLLGVGTFQAYGQCIADCTITLSLRSQIYLGLNTPAVSTMSARMLLRAAIPTWCRLANRDSNGSIRLASRFPQRVLSAIPEPSL